MKFTLLYSKKSSSKETIYLRHRYAKNGKETDIKIKTLFQIEKKYWDQENQEWDQKSKFKITRKTEHKLFNAQVDDFNARFIPFKKRMQILFEGSAVPDKEEISNIINNTATITKEEFPTLLTDVIDQYLIARKEFIPGAQDPITPRTELKYKTIQRRLNKYYRKIKVLEINDDFKKNYALHMHKMKYSSSYVIKELKYIRAFIAFAAAKTKINEEVLNWKFQNTDTNKPIDPYLTFKELKDIQDLNLSSTLDNARDWLIISCYTGQRVSDLMNMKAENIIQNEFHITNQQKGKKEVAVYLTKEVLQILQKRNGQFPKKINHPDYNRHIKIIAQKASLDEIIYGAKKIDNRKVIDHYPKWELITSHIGRRTFVTLFQPIIGKENTKAQTGHSSDSMLETYNKITPLQKAQSLKEALINFDQSL